MTFFLLLLMLTVLLLAQWYIGRQRERVATAARAIEQSGDLYYHPGHTWVSVHGRSLASVGTTELAANFAGQLAGIELPQPGTRLEQGQAAWTLVSQRGRRLSQSMPVAGKVIAVNHDLLRDPGLTQRVAAGTGWLLRIRPLNLSKSVRNLLNPVAAKSWLAATRSQITARMEPAVGVVAQDGGELLTAFGDHLNDADWSTLRDDLFAGAAAPEGDS